MVNKKARINGFSIVMLIIFSLMLLMVLIGTVVGIYSGINYLYKSKTLCGDFSSYEKVDDNHYNCCVWEAEDCINNNQGGCYYEREEVCRGHKIE